VTVTLSVSSVLVMMSMTVTVVTLTTMLSDVGIRYCRGDDDLMYDSDDLVER